MFEPSGCSFRPQAGAPRHADRAHPSGRFGHQSVEQNARHDEADVGEDRNVDADARRECNEDQSSLQQGGGHADRQVREDPGGGRSCEEGEAGPAAGAAEVVSDGGSASGGPRKIFF